MTSAEQKLGFFPRVKKIRKAVLPGVMVNRKVRPTAAGWFYNGLILLFGFAAINTGNNLLYLILAVMIGLTLASFWLSEMAITEITLDRDLPETVHAGEDFLIQYKLKNSRRFWPTAAVEIIEKVGAKNLTAFFTLVRARTEETAYAHASIIRRGRFEFCEFQIRTYFPFGLFEKTKKAGLKAEVVVLPSGLGGEPETPASASQLGMLRPGSKGAGSELFGFREYVPGDHPHWIDWKASARTSQMLVQETERESEQSITLELRVSRKRPSPDSMERESLIRKAYGLAKNYIDQGWRVRLEIDGSGIDFGSGLNHLHSIGYFLALFDDQHQPSPGMRLSPPPLSAQKVVLA